jgi:RNA recognition motif-containing protein
MAEPQQQQAPPVDEGVQLYIGNLSYDTTEADLEKLFAKCGRVSKVNLPVERYFCSGSDCA